MSTHYANAGPMRFRLRELTNEELFVVAVLSGESERRAIAHELDRRAVNAQVQRSPAGPRCARTARCGAV